MKRIFSPAKGSGRDKAESESYVEIRLVAIVTLAAFFFALALPMLLRAIDLNGDNLDDTWEAQYGITTNAYAATNLVGWWQLNGTNSTDNATDRSGNGFNGTLSGFPTNAYGPGLFSNALYFTTNATVNFPTTNSALSTTNQFTFSAWFQATNTTTNPVSIVNWSDAATNGWSVGVETNGIANVTFYDGTTAQVVMGTTNTVNLYDGNWHQVAATYATNQVATVYVDGLGEATNTITGWTPGTVASFTFGVPNTNTVNNPFILDEVRLYNRALGPTEIPQLPVTYSDFNGTGLTVFDDYLEGLNPQATNSIVTSGFISSGLTGYYGSSVPTLTKSSGDGQAVAASTFETNPLVVHVTNGSGTALTNAPITFTIASGSDGGLALTSGGTTTTSLSLTTDSSGNATVYYESGSDSLQNNTINATAVANGGSATVSFTARCGVASGLALWLKADAGVTQSSGSVSSWVDQTGNYTVTQSTSTNRPTYVASDSNGMPALHFNGSQWLYNAASTSGLNSGLTMIAVSTTSNPSASQNQVNLGNSGAFCIRGLAYLFSKQALDYGSGKHCLGTTVPSANTFVIEATTMDSSWANVAFYRNGVASGTATVSGVQNLSAGVSVGTQINGTGQNWQGDIAEVLVYNHQLNSTEMSQVTAYLINKYGFYDPNATWPLAYSSAVQAEITLHQWSKAQADAYVALQSNTSGVVTNGLTMWLKADAGVTTDGSGNVNSWADQTGNYTVTQSGSARPTYVTNDFSGEPALRFNGSQRLYNGATASGLNANMTMIAVSSATNPPATSIQYQIFMGAYSGYTGRSLGYTYAKQLSCDGTDFCTGAISANANTFVSEAVTLDSSLDVLTFYRNGLQTATATATSLQNVGSGISIGGYYSGSLWQGDIAEVLVYDHKLSSSEMAQVSTYLAGKYGIYDAGAAWIANYSTAVQAEINLHQWNKAQADAYVALQSNTSGVVTNGLTMWFKADAGVTQSSGSVSSWTDQAGNYTVTQSGSAMPTYVTSDLNGEPGLRFGGSQWLSSSGSLDNGLNNDLTIVTVGMSTAPSQERFAYYLGQNSTNGANRAYCYYSGDDRLDCRNSGSQGGPAPSPNSFVTAMAGLNSAHTQVVFYRDGVQIAVTSVTGTVANISSGITVGSATSGVDGWQGDIAEVLVYDHQLSSSEMAQLGGYLGDKYGLYDPNATWPLAYSSAVQAEITLHQWSKAQADAYVALQSNTSGVVTNGLTMWLKADTGVTTDGSGNVNSWADQTGNYTVTQSGSARPTYVTSDVNGEPALRFTSTQSLNNGATASGLNADMTIIAVSATSNLVASQQMQIIMGSNTSHATRSLGYVLANQPDYSQQLFADGTAFHLGGIAPSANTFVSEAVTLDSSLSNLTFYRNGAQTATATISGLQNVAPGITIGGYYSGTSWQGDIAEMLVYDHKLSSSEMAQVSTYLAGKYGIYDAGAAWIANYSTAVQAEINLHQWNKAQADAYVAFQSANSGMLTNGLSMWYKADAGVTQSSGSVSSWADQTGNYTVTQSTGTNQPTYVASDINGKPALRFNGSQRLVSGNNLLGLGADLTMIAVSASSNPSVQQYQAYLGDNSGQALRAMGYRSSDQMANFASGAYCLGTTVPSANTFVTESTTLDSSLTNVTFYRNGVQSGTGTVSGVQNVTAEVYIGDGNNLSVYQWHGDIAEVLVYDHKLSAAELNQVHIYLANKYGLYNPSTAWSTAATSTFSPVAGTYASAQTVTASSSTSGATIYYTTDGSTPTTSSASIASGGTITVAQSETLKAMAVAAGYNNSSVASASYILSVATPTLSLAAGTYASSQTVTVSSSTSGTTIYYTLDGSTPTTSSASIASGGTITVTQSETLKVIAIKSGYTNSSMASATYEVTGAVAAGYYHSVALKTDGTVWTWGDDENGQLGNGTTSVSQPTPGKLTSLSGIVAVAAGQYHTLALKSDGTVWAWGLNSSGQLGDNTTTQRTSPVEVKKSNGSGGTTNLTNIVAICAGGYHNLALDSSGNVWVWGDNSNGQLGDGTTTTSSLAEQLSLSLSGGVTVEQLAAGAYHSLLLESNGTVLAWGLNSSGQVGDGTTTDRHSPVTISGITGTVIQLAGGDVNSAAVTSSGAVYDWGANGSSQIGDGTNTERNSPTAVTSLTATAVSVVVNRSSVMAIASDGTTWSWGGDSFGWLGNGSVDTTGHTTVTQMTGVTGTVAASMGYSHTLILKNDGTVWVCGLNNYGQLGTAIPFNSFIPLPVLGSNSYTAMSANTDHNLMIKSDGTVWGFGDNVVGDLGNGTNLESIVPVQATGLSGMTAVAAGYSHSVTLKSDGTVWAFGHNTSGQLGDGTTTNRYSPVQTVGSLSGVTVSTVTASNDASYALKQSDGSIWSWGLNNYGQLGDGTTSNRANPVEVKDSSGTALTGFTAISASINSIVALKSDGTVWAWGLNSNGQLGNGTTTNSSHPVEVIDSTTGVAMTGVVAVQSAGAFVLARKSNNTVWAWGLNTNGELGDGTTTQRTEAVQVSGLSGIIGIGVEGNSAMALKNDGTLWGWGFNFYGELGLGNATQETSPVQLTNFPGSIAMAGGPNYSTVLREDGSLAGAGGDLDGQLGSFNSAVPAAMPGFNANATVPTPTVSITAPSNNATLALGQTETLTASASETGGTIASVSYYYRSNLIGTSTSGSSYSVTWTPPTWGTFPFTAIATDTAGNTSYRSSIINVIVPYDSDSNSLPDWWELKYFGHLGNSASSSPDGNGYTLLQDYEEGSNPTNYYSQDGALITPTITISSGNSQSGIPSAFLANPMVVHVVNSSGGAALVNAPVTFTVTAGGGLVAATSGGTTSSSLQVNTDSSGNAQVYYQQPSGFNVSSTITATTDSQSVSFSELSAPPGLALWLKADAGVTQSSGNVSAWADQTGNYPVTQSGSARPTYIANDVNGKPALRFNSYQYMTNSSNMNLNSDVTLIAVAMTTNPSAFEGSIYMGGNSTGTNRGLSYYSSVQIFDGFNVAASGAAAPNANTFVAEEATMDSSRTNIVFYRNGTQTATASISGVQNVTSGIAVGCRSGDITGGWQGDIAEVLVYDHKLTSTELSQVDGYLADKYGYYSVNATWPLAYTTEQQAEITRNQWSKAQADAYVAFLATSPPVPAAGLNLWLKADAGVTVDGSGNVQEWADQGPAQANATQSNSSNRPQVVSNVINGKPVIRFDGSSGYLQVASGFANLSSGVTVFAVFTPTTTASWERIIDFGNGGPSDNILMARDSNQATFCFNAIQGSNTTDFAAGTNESQLNTPQEYTAVLNGSTSLSLYQNGTMVGQDTSGVLALNNVIRNSNLIGAGNWSGTPLYQGDMAEILIYNRPLTSTEQQQVEVYLADKYGLYHPDATWPLAYTTEQQAEITRNQWSKAQADAYVTFLATSPPVPATGLSLWLKADAGVTVDGSGNVQEWADQGPAQANATQSNSSNRPQVVSNVINGKPVIRFDGSSGYLQAPPGFKFMSSGVTVFAVFTPTSTATWGRIIDFGNGGPSDNILMARDSNQATFCFNAIQGSNTTDFAAGTNESQLNTPQEYTAVLNGSTSLSLYQNGTMVGQDTSGVLALNNVIRNSNLIGAGNWSGTPLYQGDMAEILIYNRPLTSTEQQQVEVYLADKYGLYHPDATWPLAYTTEQQAEITRNQWSKAQADNYVALEADNSTMLTHGLVAWYKADAGVTQSSGNVSAWADQTGNYALTQSGSAEPTYVSSDVNGKPALRFNGSQWLYNSSNLGLNADMTIITVGMTTSPSSHTVALWLGGTGTGVGRSLGYYSNDQFFDTYAIGASGGGVPSANTFVAEESTLDSSLTNVTFYRNGIETSANTLSSGVQNLTAGISVGTVANGVTANWQGDIAEVLVYDHQLTSTELAEVDGYLADKYGYYSPNATWPSTYSSDVHARITSYQWSKAQADAYVAAHGSAPTMVSTGLAMWLKADAGVTQSSGNVSAWADQTGYYTLTQSGSAEPTYVSSDVNGKPALRFNGSQWLYNSSNLGLNADMTIITVGMTTSPSSHTVALWLGGTGTGVGRSLGYYSNDQFFDTYAIGASGGGVPSANTFVAEESTLDSSLTNVTFYRNGIETSANTLSSGVQNLTAGISVGTVANGVTANWQGDIAEVIVYNHQLSSSDLQQVDGYLADKYGLFDPNASWPSAYSYAVEVEIFKHHWTKAQADNYVAFQASNSTMLTNGLTLWLRADAGVTTSGSNVTAIADQTGNYTLTQSTSGNQPTFVSSDLNGNPGIRFNGTQWLADTADTVSGLDQDMTVITVGMTTAPSSQTYSLYLGQNSGTVGANRAAGYNNGAELFDTYGSVEGAAAPASSTFLTEAVSLDALRANVAFYQNGVQTSAGTLSGIQDLSSGITFGAAGGGYCGWQGDIAEVLVYDHKLSDAEMQQVEIYLTNKYNLAGNGPAPTFSPNGGTYTSTQSVSISTSQTGTLHYTIDGMPPTASSPTYSSAISIPDSALVQAAVFSSTGQAQSEIGSAQFYINDSGHTGLPVAATSLTATVISGGEIDLSWSLGSFVNYSEIGVYRSSDGGTTYQVVTTLDPSTTSYADTKLVAGSTYQYYVGTINASGESDTSASSSVSPAYPTALGITVTTPSSATPLP